MEIKECIVQSIDQRKKSKENKKFLETNKNGMTAYGM